jgi:hypothetical protein
MKGRNPVRDSVRKGEKMSGHLVGGSLGKLNVATLATAGLAS